MKQTYVQSSSSGHLSRPTILLKWYMCLLMIFASLSGWAQDVSVTGKVTSAEDGQAVPGVNVQVVGTTRGTQTNTEGNYTISVPTGSKLRFTSVGMVTQELEVGSQTTLNVVLQPNSQALSEVVVVGYGTAKRKDLTGSVVQVTSKDFNAGVNPNPLQSIQGKVAGLVISQPSGDPTQTPTVRLRGYTSLAGGSDPLYVVDGMIGVPINTVSPQDIESMDVLKDASAAAIYGSRAANGVILITTKRGKAGKTTVSFNNYVGVATISRRMDMLDSQGYRDAVSTIKGASSLNDSQRFPTDASGKGYSTDWTKEITRSAFVNNHDIAIAGGTPELSYRGSLNYINQQGIVKTSGLDRLTGRFNLDQKALNNRLNIQYNLAYTETNSKYVDGNIVANALTFLPTLPIRNADGTYYEVGGSFGLNNPVAMLENTTNKGNLRYLQGGMNLRYELFDGFTVSVNGQLQRSAEVKEFYTNPTVKAYASNNGRANRLLDNVNSKLFETTLNYTRNFGEKNNFSVLGGYSYQETNKDGFQAANSQFVTSYVTIDNLGLGAGNLLNPTNTNTTSYRNQTKLISFFGRAMVNLSDRYNLTATVRQDGSSKFGANHKWGVFPSLGAGWTISEESFLAGNTTLNYLKLRAGWGQTGNSEGINPYNSIQLYGQKGTYYDGTQGDFLPGYGITQNANPDLRWEVLQTTNVGLDFQLLKGRFSGTIEYYNKLTKDMLYSYNVPADGVRYFVPIILANVGSMRNSGLEFSFGGAIVDKSDFSWNSNLVVSYNKNKIVSLSNDQFSTGQVRFNAFGGRGLSDVYASYLTPGRPLGEFNNVPTFVGFDANGNVLMKPGDGNEPVTEVSKSDAAKAVADGQPLNQGNPQPFLTGAFSNTFRYKNFDLNFQLRGTFGNKILNNVRNNLMLPGSILETNMLRDVNTLPTNYGTNVLTSYWIESGTFVRFDNWQIGYNIPVTSKVLSNARIYLGGNNLFVLTKYKGIDPELQTKGDLQTDNPQAPNSVGLDNSNIYPKTRTFQLGVNLTF
ncbi:TonB-dependent receptor [Siphonobacter sp. SORGH_AS_1065]|uniref:SusC/RagA family TonB-linked outer membrane protein n=1 Tax=Siphonobacter sp. SORGH_AS_1065 TaxID=3041795 RepID=UPI002784B963|nr:TonB-dependent receptor [Siphonobacter sp. SORGH_AS_1065]MDQ1085886.1 TonB-linked SusC/RagA family outer membrane protein [Siphonobacter sp. SORGH_AS_1065]